MSVAFPFDCPRLGLLVYDSIGGCWHTEQISSPSDYELDFKNLFNWVTTLQKETLLSLFLLPRNVLSF